MGRLTTETNILGTFTYDYDGATTRMVLATYPNGQTSSYSYGIERPPEVLVFVDNDDRVLGEDGAAQPLVLAERPDRQ